MYGLDIVGLDVDDGTVVPVAGVVVPNVMHVLGGLIRTADAPPPTPTPPVFSLL